MNSIPSAASLTAAVATARRLETSKSSATRRKRCKVKIADLRPSGFKRPVARRFNPKPLIAFSLYSGAKQRSAPSKTTMRTELEPMSMTAGRKGFTCMTTCLKPRLIF